MKFLIKKEEFFAFISIILSLFVFGTLAVFAQWQPPTANQPNGNLGSPITTGTHEQVKAGQILINFDTPDEKGLIIHADPVTQKGRVLFGPPHGLSEELTVESNVVGENLNIFISGLILPKARQSGQPGQHGAPNQLLTKIGETMSWEDRISWITIPGKYIKGYGCTGAETPITCSNYNPVYQEYFPTSLYCLNNEINPGEFYSVLVRICYNNFAHP